MKKYQYEYICFMLLLNLAVSVKNKSVLIGPVLAITIITGISVCISWWNDK